MQPQAEPFIAPICRENIEILHQDDSLLLINKPSGLLSLSGKHPLNKDSVHFRLLQNFPTARLLHRLDLGTSGIMLVALNKTVNGLLTKQFQERLIEKKYTAVLHGELNADEGEINLPIAKGVFPLQRICHVEGKPALSRFKVIERLSNRYTKVEFTPLSGRTHQLRIHSSALGHPILGCDLYASDEAFALADRLMLHATELEFTHPTTGERFRGQCVSPF